MEKNTTRQEISIQKNFTVAICRILRIDPKQLSREILNTEQNAKYIIKMLQELEK